MGGPQLARQMQTDLDEAASASVASASYAIAQTMPKTSGKGKPKAKRRSARARGQERSTFHVDIGDSKVRPPPHYAGRRVRRHAP